MNKVLEEMLKDKENVIKLLELILNISIKNIEIEGLEHFEGITEYKFSLLKINLKCDNDENKEVYLKMIKGGKIKESIFCFWSLLYEEYLRSTKKNKTNNIQQKTIITQKTSDKNISKIILSLNQDIEYYAEINLIEIKNFAIENNKLERWVEDLEIKSDNILFVGIKTY